MPRRFRLNPKTYEHIPQPNVIGNYSNMSHIYYNLQITNNTTNYDLSGNPIDTLLAVTADFSQQRAEDFIGKPSQYTSSVTYFHLDSNSFPLQVVQPVVGKSYQNSLSSPSGFTIEGFPTIYSFTVEANWYTAGPTLNQQSSTSNVFWKPIDITLNKPPSPINKKDLQNEYFWGYSYDYFLDLLNNSIAYEMDTIATSLGLSTQYPYFYHSGDTNLIYMDTPLSFQTLNNGSLVNLDSSILNTINWKIYVNEPLYQLLSSMPSNYGQYQGFYGYQLLSIVKGDTSNIITQDIIPPSNYIKNTQEYASAPLWNPCVSIVFTTPNFNVVNEMNALPFVDGFDPNPKVNNADALNILFEYFIGRRADPTINNFVRAEYRLTDLLSIQPQSDLIVKTYWKDEFGILHPFFIEQGSGMNMKIMFRKKAFN